MSGRLVLWQLLLLLAFVFSGPAPGFAQEAPALADLEWLAGEWVLERPGERLDESWSAPAGNSMVGHFRWIREGELWITELVTITAEGDNVVFRLRHFSADMTPWEQADDPFVYRMRDSSPRHAVFDIIETTDGRPDTFVFEALPGDSLLVRLEQTNQEGTSVQEYRYGRAR